MAQSQNLKRRIEKIERELEPEKGACLRFPDGQGGFIEAPGCRSLVDVIALAMASDKKQDETERK